MATSEETLVVTWTLASKKLVFFGLLSALMISGVSADYYYGDSSNRALGDQTGFSVPEYDSQQEVISQLVAPFIFVAVLLHVGFSRALRFAFVDDSRNTLLDLVNDNEPNGINRKSMLMSIAVTAMLVPTPFWQYVRFAMGAVGLVSVTIFAAAALLLFYWFLRG